MPITTHRPLPPEIKAVQDEMEAIARSYGLDVFETIFEVLDYEELSMFAAYGGFPVRYPHWRFGAEFNELMKSYSYGLQKIYEMVINTDPCYAYLLSANAMLDQKLVIAHVYGHCDFFKNNAWFAPTNRRMLDAMANHAARINRYVDRFGYETVEQFVDACLSIEDLIDPHAPHIRRRPDRMQVEEEQTKKRKEREKEDQGLPEAKGKFKAKEYMDAFINPPDVLLREEEKRKRREEEREASRSFPDEPQRDVLLFLLEHARLKEWQADVLSIIRDEAYYFAPQGQTKILNEGWASYWHSTIMTERALESWECIDYADHHSGTMAMSRGRVNPYKLGIELLRDVERRWNTGQFGKEWEECDDLDKKRAWNLNLGLGRKKIFEVRKIHNDVTFIDTFLTPDFCKEHKLFSFAHNEQHDNYVIESREFHKVKQRLLFSLTNHGRPFIYVVDGNYKNRGELLLRHEYNGIELRMDRAVDTLANLQAIWSRPVHLNTVVDNKPVLISHDGTTPTQKNLGEADDPRKHAPPATK
jgi:stage V sporulation protein R